MTDTADSDADSPAVAGVTRRTFVKGSTVGVAAIGAGGYATSPVAAFETPWGDEQYSMSQAAQDALTAGNVVAVGYDYLMGTDYVDQARTNLANYTHRQFGDMSNYGGYTGEKALWQDMYLGGVEMQQSTEKVMTSIQNNIEASDNVAYSKGQVEIAEAFVDGKTNSEAQAEMNAVISDYYTDILTNIINHWNTQIDQLVHYAQQTYEHGDLLHEDVYGGTGTGDSYFITDVHTIEFDVSLPNGETQSMKIPVAALHSTYDTGSDALYYENFGWFDDSTAFYTEDNRPFTFTTSEAETKISNNTPLNPSDYDRTSNGLGIAQLFPEPDQEADGHSQIQVFGDMRSETAAKPFPDAWGALSAAYDRVNTDLSGYANDVYANYEPSEVDVSDLLDATAMATEYANEEDWRAFQRASAASLGYPTQAESNVIIRIEETGDEVWVDLFTDHEPDGGFEVGTTYQPSTWDDPLIIVYETEDGSVDKAQLEKEFTITAAYDKDGNEIESFGMRETNTRTSDVQQFQEELEALRQLRIDLQSDYVDDGDPAGAGAGWFNTDGKTLGIVALGGAVIALLLSGDSEE